jgi:beta-glucosidase
LKNDARVLPLRPTPGMKIAVIGPNARSTCYSGGGSASLAPTYLVSPLDAITAVAEETSASVQYSVGADNNRWTPLLTPFIQYPDEQYGKGPGVVCEFFDTDPWETPGTKPLFTKTNNSAFSYFIDGIPKQVPVRGYVSLKTRFKPDVTGAWLLGLGVAGQADLYVDGRKVVDNSTDQQAGLLFVRSLRNRNC